LKAAEGGIAENIPLSDPRKGIFIARFSPQMNRGPEGFLGPCENLFCVKCVSGLK
jgi:hypothetical protein